MNLDWLFRWLRPAPPPPAPYCIGSYKRHSYHLRGEPMNNAKCVRCGKPNPDYRAPEEPSDQHLAISMRAGYMTGGVEDDPEEAVRDSRMLS